MLDVLAIILRCALDNRASEDVDDNEEEVGLVSALLLSSSFSPKPFTRLESAKLGDGASSF
jgi:hypothetical protein